MIGNRFPALSRHWAILRESWKRQNEAEGRAKPRSDHEFLPAALEIMEKPPSPGLRWLMLGLCALFATALAWSFIGKVDVVAVATGKVIPAGEVKLIQPIEIGSVRAIHVRNGQRVQAGQLLIELDPTIAGADVAQAGAGLIGSQVIAARNAALLAHLQGRPAAFNAPAGTSAEIIATQQQFIRAAIAEFEAERASLGQQRGEQVAQLAGANAEIAKLRQTLPLIDKQMKARAELSQKGYYSKLRLLEYEQLRVEHIQNINVQEANAAKARSAIGNIDAQQRRLRETFGRTAVTELATAQNEANQRSEELTKSERRRQFQQLRAPVNGTVQQLEVSTIGGVVQPAQPLMVIVPDNAQPVVEAQIMNKDIGFIREGQPVRIKLEAYNFTDYGLIPGVVESISRDAIDMSQPGERPANDGNGRQVQQGLVYASRIRLLQNTIRIAGKDQPIGPGLAVQAEIKTGERKIIQYLLSPIAQTFDEAGRER
jgi:hemolysin D